MSSELLSSSSSFHSRAGVGSPRAASRRRRWSAAQKQDLLHEFAASGLNAAQFCRERGLSAVTFSGWRRKFGVKSAPASTAFTRVRVLDDGETGSAAMAVQVDGPGGFRFRVPMGCDPRWVAGLLRAVASD